MKNRSTLMAATAVLALGLSACGDDQQTAQTSTTSAASSPNTASASGSSSGAPSSADSGPGSASSAPTSSAGGPSTSPTEASATSAGATHASPATTQSPASTASRTASSPTCAPTTAQQAAEQNIPKIARPFADMPDVAWQVDPYFGSETYDPCAPLSYIVIGVQGATASSPNHIMLFHHGAYLGTATKTAPGFAPKIRRVSPSTIAVTYTYPKAGESNAGASGHTYATFRWSEGQHRVIMTGNIPPTYGD